MSDPDLLPPAPPNPEHADIVSAPPVLEHEPAPPPPPTSPATIRRGGTPFILTLLLFAGLAGGLYWVWTNPRPQGVQDTSELAAQVAALASQVQAQTQATKQALEPMQQQMQDFGGQIQALAGRVQKIEQAPQAQAAPSSVPDDQARRLDELSSKLDALSAKEQADAQKPQEPQAAADPAALSALSQRLDQALAEQKSVQEQAEAQRRAALDGELAQEKSTVEALTGRLAKLERGTGAAIGEADRTAHALRIQQAAVALDAGLPLGEIPGAPPELARFATRAPPTETALKTGFAQVSEAARAASRPEDDQRSFLDRAVARVERSVTVRRGDHVIVGDPAAGLLARAQEKVVNDDLAGAAEALSGLHGPAGAAVADWVAQVRALLAARAALATLSARG